MGLTQITAAVTEPVSLDLVKRACRFLNPQDNDLLQMMAIAAREWCERYLSQVLCQAQFKWSIDRFINLYLYQTSLWTQQVWPWQFQSQSTIGNRLPNSWYTLWPPVAPIISIDKIEYIDLNGVLQTLDPAQYVADLTGPQARITPAFGQHWPPTQMRVNAITVTFTAGRLLIPARYKLAICQLAAHWFDQREAVTFDQPVEVPLGVTSMLGPPCGGGYMTP
jgi:hypothetical protein